jgi:hypothetical protein
MAWGQACEICDLPVVDKNGELVATKNGEILLDDIPWIFKTKADETQLIINTINISAGGKVTINWGDGVVTSYTGNNNNITKNYTSGQYTIKMYCNDWSKVIVLGLFGESIIDKISNVNFGNLTDLTQLLIRSNQLTGSIPTEFGNLTKLTLLWLHSNQLTGSIPTEFGNLTNLTQLLINSNQLIGSIPDISVCKKITIARFYDNSLTGIDSIHIPNNSTEWRFDGNIFASSEVNEVFEDANAGITVPTANFTIKTEGTNMGKLPDGAANVHLVALGAKYTAASKLLVATYNAP